MPTTKENITNKVFNFVPVYSSIPRATCWLKERPAAPLKQVWTSSPVGWLPVHIPLRALRGSSLALVRV
jgi:hypothetical protein